MIKDKSKSCPFDTGDQEFVMTSALTVELLSPFSSPGMVANSIVRKILPDRCGKSPWSRQSRRLKKIKTSKPNMDINVAMQLCN